MTLTPEMIEAAVLGMWEHTTQFSHGISWKDWKGNNPYAAEEFEKGVVAGLKAALAAMWRPISEHDGTTKHVLGMDANGDVCSMWYFAPSSMTRNWWRVGGRRKRQEECFPVYFCPHPTNIFEDRK